MQQQLKVEAIIGSLSAVGLQITMLKVRVSQVGCDAQTGQAVVLLNEPACQKVLPIWIGLPEATAISWALQGVKSERPLTHQLLSNTIDCLNFDVERVEISELKNRAFLANLYLLEKDRNEKSRCKKKKDPRSIVIDARPSDAIAIALLNQAPIFVDESVFEEAAVAVEISDSQKDVASAGRSREEIEKDDNLFAKFLEEVKASDFKLPDDQKES